MKYIETLLIAGAKYMNGETNSIRFVGSIHGLMEGVSGNKNNIHCQTDIVLVNTYHPDEFASKFQSAFDEYGLELWFAERILNRGPHSENWIDRVLGAMHKPDLANIRNARTFVQNVLNQLAHPEKYKFSGVPLHLQEIVKQGLGDMPLASLFRYTED